MGVVEMTHLFIIILNFNGGREVIDCLDSLIHSSSIRINSNKNSGRFENYNIIVVDNGSTDDSVEFLKGVSLKKDTPYQELRLIENKKNLGFAGGMNVGIKYALKNGADAVLLLHQDTIVKKGFLAPLIKNPADIVAPVIKFKREGNWVYDFGGRVNWRLGRPRHVESNTRYEIRDTKMHFDYSNNRSEIDYVSGCAMLVKRPVFEKIGLLDERFFLYFEDVDFCLRARKAGFKIAVEPKSVITHRLSEKKKKPLKQHFYHLKSNFIFVNKYLPLCRRLIAYIYLVFLLFRILWNHFRSPRRSPFPSTTLGAGHSGPPSEVGTSNTAHLRGGEVPKHDLSSGSD